MSDENDATSGFAETKQSRHAARSEDLSRPAPAYERIKLGDGGRLVIPAGMRDEMGIKPGDALIAYVEDGELRIRSYDDNLRRVQARLSANKKPGQSVVDEFLSERRAMWGEDDGDR